MAIFIKALFLVVAAEMGDKTQLLAMVMAGKYKVKQVMLGVFVATVLNHAFAVAVGSCLGAFIPIKLIQIIAAVLFLLFGLWTLRGDKVDDDEVEHKAKFGPVITVAIAFFLAEMGDKTQLMTITLSAQNSNPLFILMGSTTGMMIADGIGIVAGAWLFKHIPEVYIKWCAGIIFMAFGTFTLYKSLPSEILNVTNISIFALVILILVYFVGVKFAYHGQVNKAASKGATKEENESII